MILVVIASTIIAIAKIIPRLSARPGSGAISASWLDEPDFRRQARRDV
jgi:hypothetical protein